MAADALRALSRIDRAILKPERRTPFTTPLSISGDKKQIVTGIQHDRHSRYVIAYRQRTDISVNHRRVEPDLDSTSARLHLGSF